MTNNDKTVSQILGSGSSTGTGASLTPAVSNLTMSDLRTLQSAFAQYDAQRAADSVAADCCCCCTAVSSTLPSA